MIRQRGPFSSAPSKASPQTLCQKCLKRGHYSYECKSSTQERPYVSRPSRTQQLTNPKLLPQLTSDVPNDLLRKKGVADEQLAKKEAERGRKRKLEDDGDSSVSRKMSRSASSYSSVSTISTNRSRSVSADGTPKGVTGQSQLMSGLALSGKRRRSRSSSISYTSDREQGGKTHGSRYRSRRHLSPALSGRREDRPLGVRNGDNKHLARHQKRSRSLSSSSESSYDKRLKRRSPNEDRGGKRRRRASRSPDDRGRERDSEGPRRTNRRTYSPSESRDRSEVTRHRKSMTPGVPSKLDAVSRRDTSYGRRDSYDNDHDRYGGSARNPTGNVRKHERGPENRLPPPRKGRSLSPFSKRLALTQAMNTGR